MKNECSHPYKWYDQCHLDNNRIHLRCATHKGCGIILKKGHIFRQSDYYNNNLNLSTERRIVWDDGTIENLYL
jgi:hypothetical protein